MKKCISTLTTILILLAPIYAWAATYYVGQRSAGVGNGRYYANRMSVSTHNSSNFEPGDIIFLCDTITSQVCPPSSGSPGNEITYRGDLASHAALIQCTSEVQMKLDGRDYLVIDGVEFDGQNLAGGDHGIHSWGASDYITIKNCYFHGHEYKGIKIDQSATHYSGPGSSGPCTNWTVGGASGDGNTFYNIGNSTASVDVMIHRSNNCVISYNTSYADSESKGRAGFTVENGDNVLIEYNKIYGHYQEDGVAGKNSRYLIIRFNKIYNHDGGGGEQGNGINIAFQQFYPDFLPCRYIYIYGNEIHNNYGGIVVTTGARNVYIWGNIIYDSTRVGIACSYYSTASTVWIYNNTILNCGGSNTSGLYNNIYVQNATTAVIKNNILYHSQKASQIYIANASRVTMDYNHYYYTGGTPTVHWGGSNYNWNSVPGQEANASQGDPKFENTGSHDFRLKSDSPCKNTGDDLSGLVASVTIAGTTHNMYWHDGIDDSYWDWNTPYLKVKTADQTLYGSWEKGAYVFTGNEPTSIITPTGLKLKVYQE